ncbi:hypothetical protein [Mucilaginibacter auburnensis]|uniref:Uncharacterized protein n=1 Tax=Mucilaginibacter auburnensis TaxID=1457233 RepID=A0A2H9VVQ4_9SPHI|nr:hypothetical protein [Mucilaginibacter auburnensis]PJJ84900.1 hypothetical protein CLV57_1922 [Mucilaginibacter auburnensis]
MKKILIAATLVFSTGLTAWSVTRGNEKEVALKKATIEEKAEAIATNTLLGTAD